MMDIFSTVELAQHFISVIQHDQSLIRIFNLTSDAGRNITTALTEKDAMSPEDRIFHVSKLALSTAGLVFSAMTTNFAGLIGFAIPEAEELRFFNDVGERWKRTHQDHEDMKPSI